MWIVKAFKVIGVEGFLRGTLENWDFNPPLGLSNDIKNNLNPIDFLILQQNANHNFLFHNSKNNSKHSKILIPKVGIHLEVLGLTFSHLWNVLKFENIFLICIPCLALTLVVSLRLGLWYSLCDGRNAQESKITYYIRWDP